ncbi:aminotransferase class III-fold pyridoxal phosphate-dependent enzyme [Peribacillus butanolivorans]|uniref:Aminotransferase class III-fold pyridoxal phosphate-dependent enzyme n=1 Tax=Peribacillus butanolivorans TaxID=421767 RepID=A0ABM6XSX7_9BACI|nr:aminotransferase class III-fold pyridoxal phosphate-dependent enzyme [Peribacillus butanolivorans]
MKRFLYSGRHRQEVGAVIMEPVQGEGGFIVLFVRFV